ncbi:MAG: hypothetical protein AMXMBFR84_25220 [Candidatus Hydrogenedentota bacterium]
MINTYFARNVFTAAALVAVCASGAAEGPVQFNRDIRPIISDKCFACHGPDKNARKMNLRLDQEQGLFGMTRSGEPIVTRGKPDESVLFELITAPDPKDRMPPASSHKELTASEIDTIRLWIEQGAPWQGHWSFIPPVKPAVPAVVNAAWCENEIDYFVLERLEKAGLVPSNRARKDTLIRRVSLDITGLPPTPSEVDAFLADTSENAYETLVDRLLASPHFGERMAFKWLDAARYADTNGYQRDTKRDMWAWRDWVIHAFNDNMPYNQFATEQLAGDLLPNATLSQRIATGFNRNHRINGEGGIIPEEYAVEYVVDRVNTTSTAFLGLAMECARCHDHKFDPLSQREFYELYAFFNRVPENGKGEERGNDVPIVLVPTPEQTQRQESLKSQIAPLEASLSGPDARLDPLQAEWEKALSDQFAVLNWTAVNSATLSAANGTTLTQDADGSILADGPNPDKETHVVTFDAASGIRSIKLEILADARLPQSGPGRSSNGNLVLSEFTVTRVPAESPNQAVPVKVAHAYASYSQDKAEFRIANTIDGDVNTGWSADTFSDHGNRTAVFVLDESTPIAPGDRVTVSMAYVSQYAQHAPGRFRLSQSPSSDLAKWTQPTLSNWHYVGPIKGDPNSYKQLDQVFEPESGFDAQNTYTEGALQWKERPDWQDGQIYRFESDEIGVHFLHRTIDVAVPTGVTFSIGSNDAVKILVDGQNVFASNEPRTSNPNQNLIPVFLTAGRHDVIMKVVNFGGGSGFYFRLVDDQGQGLLALMDHLASPLESRSPESRQRLQDFFRRNDAEWKSRSDQLAALKSELQTLEKSIVSTMVMEDMPTPRDTYLLKRGVYDKPDTSEKLTPGVPAVLGEMDPSLPLNRLGFAQWLTSPSNPLAARVRVNQYWQLYFGKGIVKTSEDFGAQGTPPTHPELLDWLATRFIESGWDVKAMQKLIVMSATYQQSSVLTADHREKDPENLLLGRAPRFRLAAETVRDQALAVSGLLSPAIGGPSVKPYQPADVWSSLTFQNMDEFDTNFYVQDTGDKLYRRGLYTYWKRTIAPPTMQIFNAAGREMCSMRQEATNTPMQALVVLNDPTYTEASRQLAQRMILEGGDRSSERVRYGYKLVLAHEPSETKQQILLAGLNDYQSHFIRHADDAKAFVHVGDSEPDASIPEPELAAYTMLASVMLNLDEAITRE